MANSIEVARAYVTIVPSLQGAQKTIAKDLNAETNDVGEESGKKIGSNMSSGIGSALKAGATAVVGAVTAIASAALAGVVAITKEAVSQYADYEQLVGGVDKLFGETSNTVIANAQNAFQTAGMSANEYMETVTGFSASLLQGLEGDTEKAAQLADLAITDMSDNANTFGTDIESIQNAYSGFAKGNFTMLDNLKLGYGGTASEMLRLVNDSGILEETIDDINDVSFDQMIEAIHAVQENMEIAGTTSKEALGTISGSVNATKSAWSNFLTSLASGDVDMMSESLDGLALAIFGVEGEANGLLNNIIPVVETTITSLSTIISTQLPGIITRLLPVVTGAINTLLANLAPMLPTLINTLVEAINMLMPTVIDLIVNSADTLTALLMGAVSIITTLVTALADNGNTEKLVNGAVQVLTTLVEGIAMNLPVLLPAVAQIITELVVTLTKPENIELLLNAALLLLGALVVGLAEIIPVLIEGVVGLLDNIANLFCDAVDWVADVLCPTVVNFWNTTVTPWLESVKTFFANIWDAIKSKISSIWNAIVSFFVGIFTNIKNNVTNTFTNVKNTITNIFDSVKNTITNTWNNIKNTVTNNINNIKTNITNVFNAVKSTVTSIWNGIKTAITNPIETAKSTISTAIENIKSILSGELPFPSIKLPHFSISGSFSLNPPSYPTFSVSWYGKAYDQAQILNGAQIFGVMGGQLLGGGERGSEVVVGEQHLMDMISKASNPSSIVINVYASEGMNEESLAEKVAEKLQAITESKEVVYA